MSVVLWSTLYLDVLFLISNGHMKGNVSNLPSFCINIFLTDLLSSSHSRHIYFRYGGEKLLDIWKGLDWYCWLMCVCTCWHWLGPLWWIKVFTKFMLKIGSIMFGERIIVMSKSSVSRVSNTNSIVNVNLLFSWCLLWLVFKFSIL